jgi:hypothetical protein
MDKEIAMSQMLKNKQVLQVADGLGVDSMAMLILLRDLGIVPDAILFANTAAERDETYRYLPVVQAWCRKNGFPEVTVVEYVVKNFKNWPPYFGLEENCLTNGTLPSEAFGMGSCSEKWKQQPQNNWTKTWAPAVEAWARGEKIKKAIGYDDSTADKKRSCSADRTFKAKPDAQYDYWYPLQEHHIDRKKCIQMIVDEQLPGYDPVALAKGKLVWVEAGGVPTKSSCFFCPNMKGHEVDILPAEKLARIVIMEARAKVRLEGHMSQEQLDAKYEAQLAKWVEKSQEARRKGLELPRAPKKKVAGQKGLMRGLWRAKMMTDYIREKGLLSGAVIDRLIAEVPTELVRRNEAFAKGQKVESWDEFMTRVMAEVAIEAVPAFRAEALAEVA